MTRTICLLKKIISAFSVVCHREHVSVQARQALSVVEQARRVVGDAVAAAHGRIADAHRNGALFCIRGGEQGRIQIVLVQK